MATLHIGVRRAKAKAAAGAIFIALGAAGYDKAMEASVTARMPERLANVTTSI